MITDEVYVEIELLRKHGMSLRKIAEEVGCAVNTVQSHLEADTWPRYKRNKLRVTQLSPFEEYLRERQAAAHPAWIPATVLLREIVALGYTGSHSQLRSYMHGLKPTLPVDPVVRFETAPGEQMQVDWVEFRKGKNPRIPDRRGCRRTTDRARAVAVGRTSPRVPSPSQGKQSDGEKPPIAG